jgi:hypothetical protein
MDGNQSKNTPLECRVKNFKKGFNRDYGVKLTSKKLRALCEVDWPALGVGWPLEGLLDKTVVNEVYRVIVGRLGNQEQFPYIECWQDAVLSQPTCLRPYLEEACRIMVARVAAASKCREKAKEPVLALLRGGTTTLCATLSTSATSAHFCTPTSDTGWGNSRDSHTCKIWFGSLGGLCSSKPPESYRLHTHSESTSAHPTSPIQSRASNQSL